MDSVRDSFRRQGLVRPAQGRVIGGVCAGVGRRFGIDAWLTRLLFVLVMILLPGSQLLIYPVLWILMPSEDRPPYGSSSSGYPTPPAS
ncbi:MAG TPA: PspC domain-containing protein [Kineosporiaceae bacterium]|nr:PspC domain-containing protein [Kineosporiaceae bacterium]